MEKGCHEKNKQEARHVQLLEEVIDYGGFLKGLHNVRLKSLVETLVQFNGTWCP